MPVIILAGEEYEVGRFTIGQLKQMTEIINSTSENVVERSRLLLAIALARKYPDLKVDDDLETDISELNAAAATVVDVAGFVMVGKSKAVAAAA